MPKTAKQTASVLYVELDHEHAKAFKRIKGKANTWERSAKAVVQRLIREEIARIDIKEQP